MSIIIDINKCYYKWIINGAEYFDCFTAKEQEIILNGIGFEFNISSELADEINSEPRVIYDNDREEYRSDCDEPWNPEIKYAKIYDNIDQAFGDLCEPYVVDYFELLQKDLGFEVPENEGPVLYHKLRAVEKILDEEVEENMESNMIEYMMSRDIFSNLFGSVVKISDEDRRIMKNFITSFIDKLTHIKNIDILKRVYDEIDKIHHEYNNDRYLFHNIPRGKLTMIGSYAGVGKISQYIRDYALAHSMGLKAKSIFFDENTGESITKKGTSIMTDFIDNLKVSLDDSREIILKNKPARAYRHPILYGISGDKRSYFEKVIDCNKHFKSFAEKNKRK